MTDEPTLSGDKPESIHVNFTTDKEAFRYTWPPGKLVVGGKEVAIIDGVPVTEFDREEYEKFCALLKIEPENPGSITVENAAPPSLPAYMHAE